MESDRISCLPDHIIDQILSHLPIKDAGRTSVLSSIWRNKWSTQPDLVFDKQCAPVATSGLPSVIKIKFLRMIDHVLLLHSGPINKVKISDSGRHIIDMNSVADIDRWILHLTKSLQGLKLYYCWLKPPTTFEGFRNLKSLKLKQILLADVVVPVKLPTPCINLTSLSVCINFNDLKEISAGLCLLKSSPNLQVLGIFARLEKHADLLTPVSYCWEDIFSEPIMSFKLERVMVGDISGTKSELDFIRFILLYSPVLEKMTVEPVVNFTSELMTELIRFRRVSGQAEIVYLAKDSS
ncbi:F-box/FBD/LRR-repeat protein [Trifolium pratense]|uniref:F-box/FBD/LRR-repeat protein n=1 Tax=Trifolium pratense TaxID=57577 RepID=A0A2K3MY78_TRIPR|nr:F-box/FBD/LRR-repeat protein [Trifolium pratense]